MTDAVPDVASAKAALAALKSTDEPFPDNKLQDVAYQSVARALAAAVEDPDVRLKLKEEFEKNYTYAPEVIYKTIAGDLDIKGNKLGALLTRKSEEKFGTKGVDVDALARELPKLHIAMPVNLDKWDAETQVPLVAYAPPGVKDQDVKRIPAFDATGRKIWLDPVAEPDQPVIVLARNERTDLEGNLTYEPIAREVVDMSEVDGLVTPMACPPEGCPDNNEPISYTTGSRMSGRMEYIEKLYLFEDHELWWLEPEEIKVKIFAQSNTTGAGIIDDYACRRENHSGNCYQDRWDLTNKQLFGWYTEVQGYWTTVLWYEHDDAGHWLFNFQVSNVQLGPPPYQGGSYPVGTVNISSNQTNDDDIIGYKPVNFSDPLQTEFQLTDIYWKHKQVQF